MQHVQLTATLLTSIRKSDDGQMHDRRVCARCDRSRDGHGDHGNRGGHIYGVRIHAHTQGNIHDHTRRTA